MAPWCHKELKILLLCSTILVHGCHPQSYLMIQNWLLELKPTETHCRPEEGGKAEEIKRVSPFKHTILSTPYWLTLNHMATPMAGETGKCSLLLWVALCRDYKVITILFFFF